MEPIKDNETSASTSDVLKRIIEIDFKTGTAIRVPTTHQRVWFDSSQSSDASSTNKSKAKGSNEARREVYVELEQPLHLSLPVPNAEYKEKQDKHRESDNTPGCSKFRKPSEPLRQPSSSRVSGLNNTAINAEPVSATSRPRVSWTKDMEEKRMGPHPLSPAHRDVLLYEFVDDARKNVAAKAFKFLYYADKVRRRIRNENVFKCGVSQDKSNGTKPSSACRSLPNHDSRKAEAEEKASCSVDRKERRKDVS